MAVDIFELDRKVNQTIADTNALYGLIDDTREEMRLGFKAVNKRLDGFNGRLGGLEGEMVGVRSDIAGLKTDVSSLKTDVSKILELLEKR